MSRNSSGTYSLPAGNPVVTGTTITSAWGNTTMSDIASALTDSLSRTGLGGMQAGLGLFDGTASLPGLAWTTELTSGFYRAGAADYRWVVTTTELLQLTSNLLRLSGTAPIFRINESDAAANNRLWDIIASGEDLNFRVLTDALVATNWLTITRTAGVVDLITLSGATTVTGVLTLNAANPSAIISSATPMVRLDESDASANNRIWDVMASGEQFVCRIVNDAVAVATNWLVVDRTTTTVDTVNFPNGILQYGGVEVGYRNLVDNTQAGNYTVVNADRGKAVVYSGTGGHTFTFDTATEANSLLIVMNSGSGNLTLAGSGVTLFWFNGSGTISSGSRTLAVGGVASVQKPNGSTSNARVWGVGLS